MDQTVDEKYDEGRLSLSWTRQLTRSTMRFAFLCHGPEKLRRAADKREAGECFNTCYDPQVLGRVDVPKTKRGDIDQREIEVIHPAHRGDLVEAAKSQFIAEPETATKPSSDDQVRK